MFLFTERSGDRPSHRFHCRRLQHLSYSDRDGCVQERQDYSGEQNFTIGGLLKREKFP